MFCNWLFSSTLALNSTFKRIDSPVLLSHCLNSRQSGQWPKTFIKNILVTFLENYLEYWQCQHLAGILTSSLGEGQRVKLAVRVCYLEVCHFYRRTHNLISFMGIKLSHSSPSYSPNFHTLYISPSFLLCLPKYMLFREKNISYV